MLENIAWAVQGGITSASLGRMVAYQATGGEEGVAGIGDFIVRSMAVAAGSVRVGPGGGVLVGRYPGQRNESYMIRAGDETVVAVPQNAGTGTRYDMLIARVDDWNMPGGQAVPKNLPTDEVPTAKFQVITGVSANAKTAKELNLNYPAIALARIAIPAATAAITQAMITPLREKAVPRRKRDLRAVGQRTAANSLAVTSTGGEYFPNDGWWTVEVPEWASRVRIVANYGQLLVPAGTVYGEVWLNIGEGGPITIFTQRSPIDFTSPRSDPSRLTAVVSDDLAIPSAMRGTSVRVQMRGRKLGGTANLVSDTGSSMSVDLEFIESATEDV